MVQGERKDGAGTVLSPHSLFGLTICLSLLSLWHITQYQHCSTMAWCAIFSILHVSCHLHTVCGLCLVISMPSLLFLPTPVCAVSAEISPPPPPPPPPPMMNPAEAAMCLFGELHTFYFPVIFKTWTFESSLVIEPSA